METLVRWKLCEQDKRLRPDADGPWVALVDYYRRIDCLIAERDAALARLRDYDDRLSAVMPPDYKSWHENSREEWPEVAAATINTLHTQEREAWSMVSRVTRELERARAEVTRLTASLDEARAEVVRITLERDDERLIETLTELQPMSWGDEERLTQERDAARAELEATRAEVTRLTGDLERMTQERDAAHRRHDTDMALNRQWARADACTLATTKAELEAARAHIVRLTLDRVSTTQTKTPVDADAPVDLRQLREKLRSAPSHELSLDTLRRALCRVLDVLY